MPNYENLNSVLSFDNDPSCLKRDLRILTDLCKKACKDEDPKIYRKALKMLSKIEEKLWQYFMEVYEI